MEFQLAKNSAELIVRDDFILSSEQFFAKLVLWYVRACRRFAPFLRRCHRCQSRCSTQPCMYKLYYETVAYKHPIEMWYDEKERNKRIITR